MARARLRLLCGLIGCCLIFAGAFRSAQTWSGATGEVVVKLTATASLLSVAADYNLDLAQIDQFGSRSIYRLRILDGVSPRDKAEALMADPLGRIVYAEPNLPTQAPEGQGRVLWAGGGSVGDYVAQWAAGVIRLPEAHTISGGLGVTIAVLDTGLDLTHPAFAGRLVNGFDFVDMDSDPSEAGVYGVNRLFGHGTHVSGLVNLAAPDSKIMPVRVLNPDGAGDEWTLAEALAYAMDPDGNPNTADGAGVINLSMTMTQESNLIRDVLKAVTCSDPAHMSANDLPCFLTGGRGAVVAAAAGNSGASKPEYPAGNRIGGSLSVGASTQGDTVAIFSNYGSWVSIAAPGENIVSTLPGGGYGTWSGTSMATPLVAGTAALVRSASPALGTAKVTQRIVSNAVDIGAAIRYRLDAAAALSSTRKGQ